MKLLTLVRHAKSSWGHPELADFERPLNKRGERDAPRMGERLRSLDPPPDLLVSSPAIRAVTTARVIAAAIEYPEGEIELRPEIYEAGCFTLLTLIRDLPGHADHVMLFGHNPGFTDLANLLQPEPIDNVPTCGVVRMAFKVDSWTEIDEQGGHLLDFDSPRKGRRE